MHIILFLRPVHYNHNNNNNNMGARDSPDMYALSPRACGPIRLRAYISGKSLAPMLQLLHVSVV